MCPRFMVSTGVCAADICSASHNIFHPIMNSVRRRENEAIVSWQTLPFSARHEYVNVPECEMQLEAVEVGFGEWRRP